MTAGVTSGKVFFRSTGRRVLLLLLGAYCLSAGAVRAQAPGGTTPAPDEFNLSVGLGGGYTTNPAFRPEGDDSGGDSTTDLRARLEERKTSPRTEWSARYDALYTRYGSNSEFDSINHALNFDGRYLVTRRTRLSLYEHFFYSRNPLQIGTAAPTDETVILTQQTNRWRSISDAAFDTNLSRSLTLQAGATSRVERLDLSTSNDINAYFGRLGILAQIGQKDNVSSSYRYSRFDFHNGESADAVAHGMDVSWSHGPPAGAGWVLSAGVSQVTREDESRNRFLGGLTLHRPFRRFDFVSSYQRRLDADGGVASVTVAQDVRAGISGTVGRSSSLGLFAEYGTRDSVVETGDRLDLTYTGGGVRGSIAFDPRFSLSGEARRRKQTAAEGAGEDLTVDSILLALVFQVF